MSCAAACDGQRLDGRDLRAVGGRVRGLRSFCVVAQNGLVEADELRLGAGGGLCDGGVGEALGGRLGGALAVSRVWDGCEGCAGRERIRCDELGVLQLEGSQTAAHEYVRGFLVFVRCKCLCTRPRRRRQFLCASSS